MSAPELAKIPNGANLPTACDKKRPRAVSASKIVAETARLLIEGPRHEQIFPVIAFFDSHGEKIIRSVLPKLKPDGKGRLVAICGEPNSCRMKLIKVYVDPDFRTWRADDGSRGEGAFSLVACLFGTDAPSMFLAAATAKTLLARGRRP